MDQPVHEEVGVSPDRRGEVGVLLQGQTEMARVFGSVARLHEGAEHEVGQKFLLRPPLEPPDEFLEIPGGVFLPPLLQPVPQGPGEFGEFLDLARVGPFVDAVERRPSRGGEFPGDALVGQEHELLDDAVGEVALGGDDARHPALGVEPDIGIRQVEIHGPPGVPFPRQGAAQPRHVLQEGNQPGVERAQGWVPVAEDRGDGRVGQPGAAADHPPGEAPGDDAPPGGDLHQGRQHEPVHARLQAADPAREFRGEHRNRPVGEIDRSAPRIGGRIQFRPFADVVRHVRDVHAEEPVARLQFAQADGVVEIARALPVDGDGGLPAEILPAPAFLLQDPVRDRLRLPERLRGEIDREPVFVLDDPVFDPRLARIAQDLQDFTLREAVAPGGEGDGGGDDLAVPGRGPRPRGDADVVRHPRVERLDTGEPGMGPVAADDDGVFALQHPDDAPLQSLPVLPAFRAGATGPPCPAAPPGRAGRGERLVPDLCQDPVLVQGILHVPRRDEDVLRVTRPVVGNQEAVPVPVAAEGPGYVGLPPRDRVPPPPDAADHPLVVQPVQVQLEAAAVVAVQVERPDDVPEGEFPRGCRIQGPDEAEHPFLLFRGQHRAVRCRGAGSGGVNGAGTI